MALDPRITKAKKALREGLGRGSAAEEAAPNRATGTRAKYKHGYLAAKAALDALSSK